MGAAVLEKSKGRQPLFANQSFGFFHWRHIEYIPERKGFADLNSFYTGDSQESFRPGALVLGDIHVGETDEVLLNSLREQIVMWRPRRIFLHDLFNGHSISDHDRDKTILSAMKTFDNRRSLQVELNQVCTFVNALLAASDHAELYIVPSNHNFWLDRWLQSGRFMQDPENMRLGIELARAKLNGKDPFEEALLYGVASDGDRLVAGVEPLLRRRIQFLPTGNSIKVGPANRLVELGLHGHAGANGARGSLPTFERGTDRAVFGHTHTDARRNGAVNIGTSTLRRLGYNADGLSNWQQTLALVGPNGEIQVLRLTDQEWYRLTPGDETGKRKQFFPPGFPNVIPNNESNGVGQIDQYSE